MPDPDLSRMTYDRKRLEETLSQVLLTIYRHWPELPEDVRQEVERLRRELARDLANLARPNDRGNRIIQFLEALEQIPAILAIARDELLAGKLAGPVRGFGGPGDEATDTLVKRLTMDPALVYGAQASMRGDREVGMAAVPEEAGPEPQETGEEAGQAVDFHTRVEFPEQVRPRSEHPLIVQLTLLKPKASRIDETVTIAFPEPQEPEMVEVRVTAPGFSERTGVWSRTMAVYAAQDSQPAVFLLRAGDQTGDHRITVDFYHRGRNVGSFAFQTQVSAFGPTGRTRGGAGAIPLAGEERPSPQPLRPFHGLALPDQPPPPVDVELRIVTGNQDNQLHFTLHSALAHVGYHWREMGSVTLTAANPGQYVEALFQELSQLAAQPVDQLSEADARVNADRIRAIGEQLFQDLFPEKLRREYWRLQKLRQAGRIRSLLITSDEPWIPWELVRPYEDDPDTGEERGDDFLAGGFQLTRWLAGRGPADQVRIQAARLVAPVLDLAFVEEEVAYFRERLPQAGVQVGSPIATRQEVLALLRQGGVQLLHFAAHGRFDPVQADRSPLTLQDGVVTPEDFSGSQARGLRRERPVIFLNTCHSARVAFVLTRLGGWAEKLVAELGVSAFIGTHWEVNDLLAAEFATQFYENLQRGQPLGQAFHNARLAIRERQPANPTWLAYTLYGDPNSRVILGAGPSGNGHEPASSPAPPAP